MKKLVFALSTLLVFAAFNYSIYQKEQIRQHGETVLLALAPVDPRSLMQGDYMQLNYAIARERTTGATYTEHMERGYMVIEPDANKVAHFKRFYRDGEPLAPGEKRLRYHRRYSQYRIVPDSFLFQEGHAALYERAAYGIFKFDNHGRHLLTGLADASFIEIKPQ